MAVTQSISNAARRTAIALGACVIATFPVAAAQRLDELAGYWSGVGKVVMKNGATEQAKCVVTYKVNGSQVRQNVRCASQGFSFNGTAEIEVAQSGSVTGNWSEHTYSAQGAVTGRQTEHGFKLSIAGATFTATMDASISACHQSIDIVPVGLEQISKIAIGLGKC
jgi:hypothetical protein